MEEKINELTIEEKASMLVGFSNMKTTPITRLDIPSFNMSDGPSGVRKEKENVKQMAALSSTEKSTSFPTGVTLASTWNTDLAYKMGNQIGKECNFYNVNAILGPAINIKRNPLCGRNFEYLSEDPIHAGYLAKNFVKGVQDRKVYSCIKHFACNNQEAFRFCQNAIVDPRAFHEIYLKPFEIAVKKGHAKMLMTSYNQINNTFSCQNKYLLVDVLRKEWGFDGLTVTDWGGMKDRDIALNNGLDLEMPGQIKENVYKIVDGVNNNTIKKDTLDKAVGNLLRALDETNNAPKVTKDVFKESREVALEIGLEGAILLKNEDNILPLNKDKKYLIIGDLFRVLRFQGSGSSMINAEHLVDNIESFKEHNVNYEFYRGYEESSDDINEKLEKEAIEASKNEDLIIFVGGQTDYVESEGYDRENMKLPINQVHLISELIKLNKKIVFIMYGGSPVELPFIDGINSLLDLELPGEIGGEVLYKLLFGEVSPSGKTCETWPISYDDVPFGDKYTKDLNELYKESIYVGYRYYNTVKKSVCFPFGYGLSYSKFSISNEKINRVDNDIVITLNVKNIGNMKAKEVIEVYTSLKDSILSRPIKELKGFSKVELLPGEEKEVIIHIDIEDMKVFDTKENKFLLENGNYDFYISSDSNTVLKTLNLKLESSALLINNEYYDVNKLTSMSDKEFENIIGRKIEPIKYEKKHYTFETPINDLNTWFGKIFKMATIGVGKSRYKKACKMEDSPQKAALKKEGLFIMRMMPYNSIRSLCFSSGGGLNYKTAMAVLSMCNGHLFKGLGILLKKDKRK